MKLSLLLLSLCIVCLSNAQSTNEQSIRRILDEQTDAWNKGDLENFMKAYWKNDSLMFIGKSGVTYGWKNTLENYKKGYPGATAMGRLSFNVLQVKKISSRYYYVTGKWHLDRTIGNLEGHYTLLFKKIRGEWVIVADHSS